MPYLLGCVVKDCSILAFADGMCPKHYAEWLDKIEAAKKQERIKNSRTNDRV